MWVHVETPVYDYRMTMVAALIAVDGIAVVADGRSLDFGGRIMRENEEKIFELSPKAVCSFGGGVTSDSEMSNLTDYLHGFIRYAGLTSIEDITALIRFEFNDRAERDHTPRSAWLRDYTLETGIIVLVVGYDHDGPHIRAAQAIDRWQKQGKPPQPYLAIGAGAKLAEQVLEKKFTVNSKLEIANVVALEALYTAYKTEVSLFGKTIEPVGGQPMLWNLYPDKPIKKFTPQEINVIAKKQRIPFSM